MLPSPLASWEPVIPSLADAYRAIRLIRVDLLGCGKSSSPPAGTTSLPRPASSGTALDRIGADQVTVMGHSTDAAVATALAEQRPGKVAAGAHQHRPEPGR
jgi:pimeloyl-ACP methyl ester carboxylesterase